MVDTPTRCVYTLTIFVILSKRLALNLSNREQAILDTAADLVMRHGYDRLTMGDISDVLGLSRGLIYVHFKSKAHLLDVLIRREMMRYGEFWLRHIEEDAAGGTIGSVYRGVLVALQQTPFLTSIITRDEAVFGKYLRKPDNLFSSLQTPDLTRSFLAALQKANAIRQDVDIKAVAHIMDILAAGMVDPQRNTGTDAPSFTALLDTTADMLERLLTPADPDHKAGKAVLRQFADTARQHFSQFQTLHEDETRS